MKSTLLFTLLLPALALAQTAGVITYEHSERLDPSRMKIVVEGAPADAPPPPEMPQNIVRERVVVFSGAAAKMSSKPMMLVREISSGPGGTVEKEQNTDRMPALQMPFEMATFYDLTHRNRVDFLTVNASTGKEGYFTETPFGNTPIEMTSKSKKILGYVCQKATATLNGETYTLWITTDVDVTFSPLTDLMPEKGLVLEVEGNSQAFRATKVELKPVSPGEVLMSGGGKKVTQEELEAKRQRAMENFMPFGPGGPGGPGGNRETRRGGE